MPEVNLKDLGGGAVAERFNIELSKVLANIADPNTDPKKLRELQLTLKFKADEDRDLAVVNVVAKTKLAPARDIETKIIMDRDQTGKVVGAELKSNMKGQSFIDDDGDVADDKGTKITKISGFNKN